MIVEQLIIYMKKNETGALYYTIYKIQLQTY